MNPTVQELVAALTLEEKAGLCSGADFWHTKAVARLGIPAIKVSDGPHGLRTQREGSTDPNDSIEAVCFPAGCAAAASFEELPSGHPCRWSAISRVPSLQWGSVSEPSRRTRS